MNKAFTANINDQVTARGYLDENNQLIMLEPEMSGGGGSIETVTVTIGSTINNSIDIQFVGLLESIVCVGNDEIVPYVEGVSNDINITVLKDSAVNVIAGLGDISSITVKSGSAEVLGSGAFKATGDCAIEVS